MIIYFCKNGQAVGDWDVSSFVDSLETDGTYEVSNFSVVNEIRARVGEDRLSHNDITLYVEDDKGKIQLVPIDEDGRIETWYKTMEIFGDVLDRLLDAFGCNL